MEALFEFLFRASAGIILFYFVYWIFLRNETFYRANRWFLLLALVSAVLLPLFPLHYSVLVEPEKSTTIFQALNDTFKNIQPIQPEITQATENFGWVNIILTIYITGIAIFLIRLLSQTLILIHLMIKYQIKSLNGIRIVENDKYGLPFSFFNIVFINPKFHTQADLPEIFAHEKVHIREFHWFDLLFIELLTVIFWFNPFIWMFEHAIKQNHEYLADQGVLAQGHSLARYQALLINQLMGMQIIGITNNLNFALNTNRFKMMTKMKTSRLLGVKFVWALPAVALLLFAFAEPSFKAKNAGIENSISTIQKGEKEFVIKGKVVQEENGKPLSGASVIIKGTSVGTVTDSEGKFTLIDPNPKKGQTNGFYTDIVISYVGLETRVLTVSSVDDTLTQDLQDIKMKEGVIYIDLPDYKNVPPPPPPPPVKSDDDEVFTIVEELPRYPGGIYDLAKYVAENQLKISKQKTIKGKAKIGFTISETGKVADVKIIEAENETFGKVAASIVEKMPDWKPGSQRGKPVPVNYILPVEF